MLLAEASLRATNEQRIKKGGVETATEEEYPAEGAVIRSGWRAQSPHDEL